MTRAIGIAALVAALAVTVAPTAARADDKRILVLPFSGSVPGVPDGPARLTKVVARAAGLTGGEVVMGQATFADATALVGCSTETADCFGQLAASLGVQEVVIGDVHPADGGQVTITMKFFQAGEVRESSFTAPAGDVDKLVARLAREASALFVPDGAAPPAEPAPAEEAAPVAAPLAPEPVPAPAPRDDGGGRRGVGLLPWALIGGGVALAAGGGAFLYLAGKRQDEVDDAPIHDAGDFDRLVELEDEGDRYFKIGAGLAIAGGAVAATGVVLAILRARGGGDDDTTSSVSVGLAPSPGGIGLAVSVRTP